MVCLALSLTVSAQEQDTLQAQGLSSAKFGLTFKKLFLDYQTTNGGNFSYFGRYTSGYELGFNYRIQPNLVLYAPLRFGVIDDYTNEGFTVEEHISTVSVDGQIHYNLSPDSKIFQPGVFAGIGAVMELGNGVNIQIPVGIKLSFPFTQKATIDWQSEFRKSFEEGKSNFQHGLGFTYWIGAKSMEKEKEMSDKEKRSTKDSDGDGVPDELDLCPHVPGSPEHFGCPDSDGDGIHDLVDKCPTIFGLEEFDGCPDSDGDGIPDNKDECPNMPGPIANNGCPEVDSDGDGIPDRIDDCPDVKGPPSTNGCPDADGDGVPDYVDQCPDVPGTMENNGCPEKKVNDRDGDGIPDHLDACPLQPGPAKFNGCPDTDGDGIPDTDDDCPYAAGPASNKGCPEIKKEDKDLLELAMRAVQFDLGKATLKTESFRILDQIANILMRYDDYNLSISGHTDNTGDALSNQKLSESRAKSCYDYLISKGLSPSRLSYAGYGEAVPIADNQSTAGRALNRRVEFTLVPRRR